MCNISCILVFCRFQYSDYHITVPSNWDPDFGEFSPNVDSYPIRAYLTGYDNSLEITFSQAKSDLDYMCIEDIQGYSVSKY